MSARLFKSKRHLHAWSVDFIVLKIELKSCHGSRDHRRHTSGVKLLCKYFGFQFQFSIYSKDLRAPSDTTLYRNRIMVDLASMVYAQRFVFNRDRRWALHIRADSSPQFGKDYLVIMCDYIDVDRITDETVLSSLPHRLEC